GGREQIHDTYPSWTQTTDHASRDLRRRARADHNRSHPNPDRTGCTRLANTPVPLESTRLPAPETPMSQLAYRRILLKLSGEALMGDEDYGIDPKVIGRLASEVIEAQQAGAEIGVVVGGGNI